MQVHLYVDDLKDRKIKPEKAVLADFWLPIPVLSFDDCVVFHWGSNLKILHSPIPE